MQRNDLHGSIDHAFRDLMPERSGGESLIHMLRQDRGSEPERFDRLMQSLGIETEDRFYVAVCVGVRTDYARRAARERYCEFSAQNLALYRALEQETRSGGRGFEAYRNYYCSIPAAKRVHHAFRGGLLMHTCFMMAHADYMARCYPFVDRDLLITGAFVHDMAKAREYEFTAMGLVNDMSLQGQLLGHLFLGAEEVGAVASLCFLRGFPCPEFALMGFGYNLSRAENMFTFDELMERVGRKTA